MATANRARPFPAGPLVWSYDNMTSTLPFYVNLVMLVAVAPLTLFGGVDGIRRVSQSRFTESPGLRTIVGSMWMAILITSFLGVVFPRTFAPILFMQILYKSLWLLVFAVPRMCAGRAHEIPPGIAIAFLIVVVSYPWAVDWHQLFRGE